MLAWSDMVVSAKVYTAICDKLDELAMLKRGWDSYDAEPIGRQFIYAARQVAAKFPDYTPMPAVVPSARGSLQFEWHGNGRSLELELDAPGVLHYLKAREDEGDAWEEDIYPAPDTERTEELIRWFCYAG